MAKYPAEEIHNVKDSRSAHGCGDFSWSWRDGSRIAHLLLLTRWRLYHHQRYRDGKQGSACPGEVHPQRPAYASQDHTSLTLAAAEDSELKYITLCWIYHIKIINGQCVFYLFTECDSFDAASTLILYVLLILVYKGCRFLTSPRFTIS